MIEETTNWMYSWWAWVLYGTPVLILTMEQFAPRKKYDYSRLSRWLGNIGVYITVRLLFKLFPALALIGIAEIAASRSLGLFNLVAVPRVVAILVSFAILDCTMYLIHRIFHSIPVFWNVHRLHHADPEIDVTTEFRHHPLEALYSTFISITVTLVFGLDLFAIVVYLFLLNIISPFSHANIALPSKLDKVLRLLIITPDMHRIHHSSYQPETDSNYGVCLSIWDRIFGTHVQSPRNGHENIQLGLDEFRDSKDLLLHNMLLNPFADAEARRACLLYTSPSPRDS